jgi:hypothetical protein
MKDVSVLELNTQSNINFSKRNVPSQNLQPYFTVAPVSTKYTVLPILDVRKTPTEHLHQYPIYNIRQTFNPGNGGAPWSGYSAKIHDESILRNQIYGLQHSSQSVYVPNSGSDLYNSDMFVPTSQSQQPFPLLFTDGLNKQNVPNKITHDAHDDNHMFFSNHTRQQLNQYDQPRPRPPINIKTQGSKNNGQNSYHNSSQNQK